MRKYLFALLVGAALAGVCFGISSRAKAQAVMPQIFVNWQADSYAPVQFPGKVLPTADSQIAVGVDLIDHGKHIDLSGFKVFWYVNDNFYQGAPGLNRITLTAPHFIGQTSITLRVAIQDYASSPAKTITIPVVPPEAVIQSSQPSLSAAAAPFTLRVYPFFFNIQDPAQLAFNWSLNGTSVGNASSFVATREMAQGGPAQLEVTVRNPARPIERILQDLTIFKQ